MLHFQTSRFKNAEWEYNDVLTIELDETSYKKTTDGHEILELVAVEKLADGTCTYTYVYDRIAGTIQVKEMEKSTKNCITRVTSLPLPSIPRTPSFANGPAWQKLFTREKSIK